MPARKMRFEVFDNEGNKYSIAFEGNITRDKVLKILDMIELLGGVSSEINSSMLNISNFENSKYNKVLNVIQKYFPISWFSSKDIQETYENEFGEPISLSTVATYLARMANRGLLIKTGSQNRLRYKIALKLSNATLKGKML